MSIFVYDGLISHSNDECISLEGHWLDAVKEENDLRVIVNTLLRISKHCIEAKNHAKIILGLSDKNNIVIGIIKPIDSENRLKALNVLFSELYKRGR